MAHCVGGRDIKECRPRQPHRPQQIGKSILRHRPGFWLSGGSNRAPKDVKFGRTAKRTGRLVMHVPSLLSRTFLTNHYGSKEARRS